MGNKCYKLKNKSKSLSYKSEYNSINSIKDEEDFNKKIQKRKEKLEKDVEIDKKDCLNASISSEIDIKNGIDEENLTPNLENRIKQIEEKAERLPIESNRNLASLYLKNNISFFNINNETILSSYKIIKKLGNGAFGRCFLSEMKKGNNQFAIKSIPLNEIDKAKLLLLKTEINCLKNLLHPNIVHFYQLFYDNEDIHMVMEPCMNGSLFDKLVKNGSFSEGDTIKIMISLLSSINYCHKNKIIHRDIKPENILLVKQKDNLNDNDCLIDYQRDLRVIDFGLSHIYSNKDSNSILNSSVGSPYFMAPEVLNQHYNSKCDVWSLGVLFYFLIAGIPPFYSDSIPELFKKIIGSRPSFEGQTWRKVSTDTKIAISKMLKKEYKERPSCEEILKAKCFNDELNRIHNPIKLGEYTDYIHILVKYFTIKNEFIKQCMSCMSSQISLESYNLVSSVFKVIDIYNNGFAPVDMLLTYLKTKDYPINSISSFNKISHLCFSDLIEAMTYHSFHDSSFFRVMFGLFDNNNNGKICIKDLKETFFKNVSKLQENEISNMLVEAGLKVGFELGVEEFKVVLKI